MVKTAESTDKGLLTKLPPSDQAFRVIKAKGLFHSFRYAEL